MIKRRCRRDETLVSPAGKGEKILAQQYYQLEFHSGNLQPVNNFCTIYEVPIPHSVRTERKILGT